MEVLINVNDYILVLLGEKNGEPQYAYGSVCFFHKCKEEDIKQGSRDEMLKDCKYSLKQCNKTLKRYAERNMPDIVKQLEEQKEALISFIHFLEAKV